MRDDVSIYETLEVYLFILAKHEGLGILFPSVNYQNLAIIL